MAPKRNADGKAPGEKRPYKKRAVNLTPVVVDAITSAKVLSSDVRSVLETALPTIFTAYQAERHAYEAEVVAEAEKALAAIQAHLEEAHRVAMEKQTKETAPKEKSRRVEEKKSAEAGEQTAKAEYEAKREAQAAAKKTLQSAEKDLKQAEKDLKQTEKEIQVHSEKQGNLADLLANEYTALKEGSAKDAAGKKAVKMLQSVGKQSGIDDTMLQTLAITSKKEPAARSDFENMIFSSLKDAIDKQIEASSQKIAELEPSKAAKVVAVEDCKAKVAAMEGALEAASEVVSAVQAKYKDAGKDVAKADDHLYQIWQDMKSACDAQDAAIDCVTDFKEKVMPAFQQLKEKEKEAETKDDEQEAAVEEEGAGEEEGNLD